jgi:heme-degrading monooxygenase HmoA
MHAVVVRVTIHNADRTREVLNSQVVPQVSGAPGFKSGHWTWSTDGGELNGLSMVIFDSEENARAAGDRVSAIAAAAGDDVTLDGVEVREVVASA